MMRLLSHPVTSCALLICALSPAPVFGQYTFVALVGGEFDPKEMKIFRLTANDDFTELDSLPLANSDLVRRLLVDPQGTWLYAAFINDVARFFLVNPDDTLTLVQTLDDLHYESGIPSLRPDGLGVLVGLTEVPSLDQPQYLRNYAVEGGILVPRGASFEFVFAEHPVCTTEISSRGNLTVVSEDRNRYRTHHLRPGGDLDPPSPEVFWESSISEFNARELDVSRDGRVLVAAGEGSVRTAISHWIADDGTVTEIDSIFTADPQEPLGGGGQLNSVLISPRRDWVLFQADQTDVWNLKPDGSFAGRRWLSDFPALDASASLSADGRAALVSHLLFVPTEGGGLRPSRTVTVLRLSAAGDLVSFRHHVDLQMSTAFLTHRRPGDCNGDGWLDATDVVCLVNHVTLGTEIPNPVDFDHADVDRDGDRDMADVSTLVDLILSP